MKPPQEINVLDQHNGFTAVTKSWTHERHGNSWIKVLRECNTLWRPGKLLKKTTIGVLDDYSEASFYQNNNNVTKAYYKVSGYRFRIAAWFDNVTGERIA